MLPPSFPSSCTMTDAICLFFQSIPSDLLGSLRDFTMTNTGPPPAAINKNQSVISTGSSLATATLSATSGPVLVNNPITSMDAENRLRGAQNDILQIRCNASESNVPENEVMLVANNPATANPPLVPSISNNTNLVQFASAFSQFSLNTQNHALSLINNNTNT